MSYIAHPAESIAGWAEKQNSQAEEFLGGRLSERQEGTGYTIGCQHELS